MNTTEKSENSDRDHDLSMSPIIISKGCTLDKNVKETTTDNNNNNKNNDNHNDDNDDNSNSPILNSLVEAGRNTRSNNNNAIDRYTSPIIDKRIIEQIGMKENLNEDDDKSATIGDSSIIVNDHSPIIGGIKCMKLNPDRVKNYRTTDDSSSDSSIIDVEFVQSSPIIGAARRITTNERRGNIFSKIAKQDQTSSIVDNDNRCYSSEMAVSETTEVEHTSPVIIAKRGAVGDPCDNNEKNDNLNNVRNVNDTFSSVDQSLNNANSNNNNNNNNSCNEVDATVVVLKKDDGSYRNHEEDNVQCQQPYVVDEVPWIVEDSKTKAFSGVGNFFACHKISYKRFKSDANVSSNRKRMIIDDRRRSKFAFDSNDTNVESTRRMEYDRDYDDYAERSRSYQFMKKYSIRLTSADLPPANNVKSYYSQSKYLTAAENNRTDRRRPVVVTVDTDESEDEYRFMEKHMERFLNDCLLEYNRSTKEEEEEEEERKEEERNNDDDNKDDDWKEKNDNRQCQLAAVPLSTSPPRDIDNIINRTATFVPDDDDNDYRATKIDILQDENRREIIMRRNDIDDNIFIEENKTIKDDNEIMEVYNVTKRRCNNSSSSNGYCSSSSSSSSNNNSSISSKLIEKVRPIDNNKTAQKKYDNIISDKDVANRCNLDQNYDNNQIKFDKGNSEEPDERPHSLSTDTAHQIRGKNQSLATIENQRTDVRYKFSGAEILKTLANAEDTFHSAQKNLKRKFLSGDLSTRLKTLVNRQRSNARIWQYELYKSKNLDYANLRDIPAVFVIQEVIIQFSHLLLICVPVWNNPEKINVDLHLDDGGTDGSVFTIKSSNHVLIVLNEDENPLIKPSTVIRVYPPWHMLKSNELGVVVFYNVWKFQVISNKPGPKFPSENYTKQLQILFHDQNKFVEQSTNRKWSLMKNMLRYRDFQFDDELKNNLRCWTAQSMEVLIRKLSEAPFAKAVCPVSSMQINLKLLCSKRLISTDGNDYWCVVGYDNTGSVGCIIIKGRNDWYQHVHGSFEGRLFTFNGLIFKLRTFWKDYSQLPHWLKFSKCDVKSPQEWYNKKELHIFTMSDVDGFVVESFLE